MGIWGMRYFVRVCWDGLWFNKLRAAFTGLGVSVGTCSVVLVLVLTTSFFSNVTNAGSQEFTVGLTSDGNGNRDVFQEFQRPEVRSRILKVESLPGVKGLVFPEPVLTAAVTREGRRSAADLEVGFVDEVAVAEGEDFRNSTGYVAVAYRNPEFTDQFIVNEKVVIGSLVFVVIGVTNKSLLGGGERLVFPTRLRDYVETKQGLKSASFAVRYHNTADSEELQRQVVDELNRGFEPGLRFVNFTVEERKALREMSASLGLFLGVIAGISLGVAALNIVNVMYIATLERSDEIAILRSMGMTKWRVLMLFLMESLLLVAIFSIVGLAAAYLIGWIILALMSIPFVFTWSSLAVVVGVVLIVGGGGGVYPALRAARVDPVKLLA